MKATLLILGCILAALAGAAQKKLVVAADGSGQFRTVGEAIRSIPQPNRKPVTVYIRPGLYREKILLDSAQDFVTFIGEDKFTTILTYDDHSGKIGPRGDTINTRTSWSFRVRANDFTAHNITFRNDAGFSAGQAVAVETAGDRARFFNCRFIGNQDVLFTNSDGGRLYLERCYIEGTTDFIFGSATAWFEGCHIHSKKNSHITAASTPKEVAFGYVFRDCILTGDTTLRNVSLGRPWRPYAHVAYLHCYMGPHIRPEGWAAWSNNSNHLTARYAEYRNTGPGAVTAPRISWSRQMTEEDAARYTLQHVFTNWNPRINQK